MARLITCGWETGDIAEIPYQIDNSATWTLDTSIVRSGSYSAKGVAVATGGNAYVTQTFVGALDVWYYQRFYVYPLNYPSVGSDSWLNEIANGLYGAVIIVKPDGSLSVGDGVTEFVTGATLPLNTWTMLELGVKNNSGGGGLAEVRKDGVSIWTGSIAWNTVAPNTHLVGTMPEFGDGSPGLTFYFDDIALNDSTGVSQNTWPGEGKIIMLKPVADSAKGTGWTNDAASTVSLFPSVDNTPPTGIADTTVGDGSHQLRNATANASSSYDAQVADYTTAGLTAHDVVTLVQPIMSTGAPSVTTPKTATLAGVSNPVVTATAAANFLAGSVVAGTYPTGWKWVNGNVTYAPAVTKGTRPVVRVTQVTSSTLVGMVSALGLLVEYVRVPTRQPQPRVVNCAPKRASRY